MASSTSKTKEKPRCFSPRILGSVAYYSIKDKLPVILTRIIDLLCREKLTISAQYGEESSEEIKEIVSKLSRMKNELQTGKVLRAIPLPDVAIRSVDSQIWTNEYEKHVLKFGEAPKWFTASWLYLECYFYKYIDSMFKSSCLLNAFDPFLRDKNEKSTAEYELIKYLINDLSNILNQENITHDYNMIKKLLKACTIGTTSHVLSKNNKDKNSIWNSFQPRLIIDNTERVYKCLEGMQNKQETTIAYVLNDVGLELVADLCLMTYLIESKLISKITIHLKDIPWFVHNATEKDLLNTIEDVRLNLSDEIGNKWVNYINEGIVKINQSPFWTSCLPISEMEAYYPELYQQIANNDLIIFKGNLNYRKLLGDLDWSYDDELSEVIDGAFHSHSNIVILSTLSSGSIVGVEEKIDDIIFNIKDWDRCGAYFVIQMS